MQWLTSTTPEDEVADWPPKTQPYAEYKKEMLEAIKQCPDFRKWLMMYRNVNHIHRDDWWTENRYDVPNGMWDLTVSDLKKMYDKHIVNTNRAENAKRCFAEMHMDEMREEYEKLEAEYADQRQAYTTAREAYDKASKYGYSQYSSEPQEPEYPDGLRMRDRLIFPPKKMSDVPQKHGGW